MALARQGVLTRTEWRLLAGIISLVRPGNLLTCSVASLAEELSMPYTWTLKAFRQLKGLGLLTESYTRGGSMEGYLVTPSLIWRGRPLRAQSAQQIEAALARLEDFGGPGD